MEEQRRSYMSNWLESINIFTPRVAVLNTARLLYHTVKPLESKEFARNRRTSHWEQINRNTISQREDNPSNCLTQKSIEQLTHLMVAALHAAIGGIQIVYSTSSGNVQYHPNLLKLKRTIRRYHHILQDLDRLRQAFPFFPSFPSVDQETHTTYWYTPILLPK